MRRALAIAGIFVGAGLLAWFFPLFHVVPLKQAQAAKVQGVFNAADFAEKLWREQLPACLERAPEAAVVLSGLAGDFKQAVTNHGRLVGMSDTAYFLMRGTGVVVSVESAGIGVALHGQETDLKFKTGLLFGNTVRDATGLVDANQFPNSQEFNDLSTALNQLVERRVLTAAKTNASVGRPLRFVVCAEVAEDDAGERPLKVIPLSVEFP